MVAIVEGDVRCVFGAGIEQALVGRVFSDDTNEVAIANAGVCLLPGLASVASSIDMRLEVVLFVTIDCGVGGPSVEV